MPYADAYGVRTETSCDAWYCRQLWRYAGAGREGVALRSGPRAEVDLPGRWRRSRMTVGGGCSLLVLVRTESVYFGSR